MVFRNHPQIPSVGVLTLLLSLLFFVGAATLLPPVSKFEDTSDNLITDSLRYAETQSTPPPFMVRKDERISDELKPYYSQFGLTYHLLLPFRAHLHFVSLPTILSLFYAALTAFTFWLFARQLSISRSPLGGTTFLTLCCLTPSFLLFSGSFYWQLPLLVAPFLLTYVLVASRPVLTTFAVTACLVLRFLGGYEYASTLILAPLTAVALLLAFSDITVKQATIRAAMLGAAGLASFFIALGIHLWILKLHEGTWAAAIDSFSNVAIYRTSGDYFARKVTLRDDAIYLISSFFRNETLLIFGLGLVTCLHAYASQGKVATFRIASALGFAFLAGMSWQVLARGHMRDHSHLNFVIYCIPFGLCVYLAFCRLLFTNPAPEAPPSNTPFLQTKP